MKLCTKCGNTKPTTEFHKRPRSEDGLRSWCIECTKVSNRAWREANRKKMRKIQQAWRKANLEKASALQQAYAARNKEKILARRMVHDALVHGDIKAMPCVECGSTHKIHGHHEDYSKPLDVIWLCQKHHLERHGRIPD